MSRPDKAWLTLPNCQDAFHLVETGMERPLKLRERIALRYHCGLCLYCSCNRDKFDGLYRQMKEIEAQRAGRRQS